MSDIAIKVEDVGKIYKLGEIGTGTISHDLNRWWAKVRGKQDPFAKIGETNDRTIKGKSDYVWALKDINFDIKQGDIVGIIGRNGAGKSTLLKILSKVTTPSTGSIKVRGRIASLLEVGTGFHPELTGRENIFLNGAILGMTKAEIKSKFDEIVDFAGVERYIDTPVKRYSSGMYVRLAFAVAAFLEPEILIVDEVLAVGDSEFQKKCLGRMKDVSNNEGRTILFVSHNLSAIRSICKSGLLLKDGKLHLSGTIEKVINSYSNNLINITQEKYTFKEKVDNFKVQDVLINKQAGGDIKLNNTYDLIIDITIETPSELECELELYIYKGDELVCSFGNFLFNESTKLKFSNNRVSYYIRLPKLMNGLYSLNMSLTQPLKQELASLDTAISLEVVNTKLHSFFTNEVSNWAKVICDGKLLSIDKI